MQIEFLGTGGAITTPRPGCDCPICAQARAEGVPFSRSGPSLFIHGPDILIDTPEEIKDQLNRSKVKRVSAAFYSHWHPDHVMGRRVWEMNHDWRNWPPRQHCTDIYLPQQVAQDFRSRLGTWEHLAFLEHNHLVRLVELTDGQTVQLGEVQVFPFRLAEDYVYAFLFEGQGKRFLIAMDELFGWQPPASLGHLDLAILPMGIVDINPLTGARVIPAEHPVLKTEATFQQTLEMIQRIDADRVILTHIEEPDGLSFTDLQTLQSRLSAEGWNIEFAYDTWLIDL